MTGDGDPSASRPHEAPPGAERLLTWTDGTVELELEARAGWIVLFKKEKPAAEVFSVSYVARPGGSDRPVTFVFNGGPGASSAYLHVGAVGPLRVDLPSDGSLPAMPPRLVENAESWVAFTDLVFLDPVGTGFSRVIEPPKTDDGKQRGDDEVDPKEFFGHDRDLASLCEAMGRWLTANDRWGSPVLIAGESYGGYRVARLARLLQETAGIGLSGAILISPALELTPLSPTDYDIAGWIDRLPSLAASAAHHGRSRVFPPETPLEQVLAEAESFATGPYATFLARGASLPADEREGTLARLADLVGLPVDLVTRAEGRVTIQGFARELLRDERKVLGLYDATVTVTDPFPDRESFAGPDPTLAGSIAAYTTSVNRLLRSEIGVDTDREYAVLSYEVHASWKLDAERHALEPPPGATDELRYGMALNPHLQTFLAHGRFDLVTPYYASDRLRNLMRLDPELADRLTVQHFDGGHMFYAWETSRRAFRDAIRAFVARATG